MSISIYLVLLIVLLIFNLVFWLLVIWFRILFDCDFGRCCVRRSDDDEERTGHGNPGFIDHEDLFGRPSTIAGQMESPPPYDEAIKYDQFGFHVSSPVHTTSLSSPLTSPPLLPRTSVPPPPVQNTPAPSAERTTQQSQSFRVPETRSRASTTSSVCPLTPITEEEFDDVMPVTVVIDCIGVQTSRLVPNCETKVNIAGAENLHEQTGC